MQIVTNMDTTRRINLYVMGNRNFVAILPKYIDIITQVDELGNEIEVLYQLDRSQIRWVGRSLPIFFILFFASMVITSLLNRLRIPHELITLVLGICVAGVISNVREYYIYNKNFIEPRNVMMILHPIIIMKLVYNIDTYLFSKSIMQILLISTLGLLIYIFIFGFLLVMLIPSKFITLSFINIVSAGIILAPIEVPDAILELDRIKHLEVLMNGECIFGTALCYMTFYLCLGGFEGIVTEWYHVICYYIRYIFVSIIIGFLIGKLSAFVFKILYNDALNAATLMVASSFFVYFLAEDIIYTSGPLATFIEMYCITLERGSLCADVDNSIQNYLNIGYYTGTLLFVILLTSNIVTSIYRLVNVLQVAVSLGSYVAGNVARLLILLMLSPILSRIGYGFNFTSMLALFWAPKKGPMQLLHIAAFQYYNLTKYMGNEFICFTIMYLLLMALINSTSLKAILQRFGLLEFSEARKNNINNCFLYINERRIRLISIMKMNRFFSDANWPLIQSSTVLTNVFKGDTEENDAENENIWGQRKMVCPGCSKNILVEPSIKDLADISREVRLRVLKAQRVSYAKQYENGLLTKIELHGLLQAVEIAMDSQDMIIKLDDLFRMFNDKALVVGYEDVLEVLPKMSDNEKIRESIRLKLDSDRLAITKELGMLGKDRPWIAITVKTKQAMTATLINMISNVDELKYAGIVDNYEYEKLYLTITDTLKDIAGIKSFPTMPPKSIFFEVPWIYEDDTIITFLYNKVTTKIWDAGDIICKQGETAEGVFILVAGLFKIKYVPVDDYLELMNNYGLLPIKDFMKNTRFKEIQDEYLMMGNSLGELSVLTDRPYSSTIIADAPSQAFIIPAKVMNEAIDISSDPVNGLAARLWKYITFILARRVMQDTPMYVSYSESKLNVILNRSFVPDLTCYRMVVLCELVEDVILIQGLIVDNNTREIYTAPCYVPRSVQKMLLPSASAITHVKFSTKLIIIPVKDANQYETMEKIQVLSELIPTGDKKHLLEINRSESRSRRHSWTMKRKGKSRFTSATSRSYVYKGTSVSSTSMPERPSKVLGELVTTL